MKCSDFTCRRAHPHPQVTWPDLDVTLTHPWKELFLRFFLCTFSDVERFDSGLSCFRISAPKHLSQVVACTCGNKPSVHFRVAFLLWLWRRMNYLSLSVLLVREAWTVCCSQHGCLGWVLIARTIHGSVYWLRLCLPRTRMNATDSLPMF